MSEMEKTVFKFIKKYSRKSLKIRYKRKDSQLVFINGRYKYTITLSNRTDQENNIYKWQYLESQEFREWIIYNAIKFIADSRFGMYLSNKEFPKNEIEFEVKMKKLEDEGYFETV